MSTRMSVHVPHPSVCSRVAMVVIAVGATPERSISPSSQRCFIELLDNPIRRVRRGVHCEVSTAQRLLRRLQFEGSNLRACNTLYRRAGGSQRISSPTEQAVVQSTMQPRLILRVVTLGINGLLQHMGIVAAEALCVTGLECMSRIGHGM
jgi:hypothetical protein